MDPIYEMFERIRKRPGMYLGKMSVTNLHIFTIGYVTAQLEFNENYKTSFSDFNHFIDKKFNNSSTMGWANLILKLTNGDEEKALERFFELLDEFKKQENRSVGNSTKNNRTKIQRTGAKTL